jgi:transcriptional regulator with XRE-family HTH domain
MSEKYLIEIGKRLKEVRKSLNLTLNDMKELSGFSIPTISDMERAANKPNLEYLLLLANKFNVNIHWILTGKGPMYNDININWDFGKDNGIIKELIFHLENTPAMRFSILKHFIELKENK